MLHFRTSQTCMGMAISPNYWSLTDMANHSGLFHQVPPLTTGLSLVGKSHCTLALFHISTVALAEHHKKGGGALMPYPSPVPWDTPATCKGRAGQWDHYACSCNNSDQSLLFFIFPLCGRPLRALKLSCESPALQGDS